MYCLNNRKFLHTLQHKRKYVILLFICFLFLQGCYIARTYDGCSKNLIYKINDTNIEVSTFILGNNIIIADFDSVKVQFHVEMAIPWEICDSLIVDELKWVMDNGNTIVHTTSLYTFPVYRGSEVRKESVYGIGDLLFTGKSQIYFTIPTSVKKMTIITKTRFAKHGILSEQNIIEIPIRIKKEVSLIMLFSGY